MVSQLSQAITSHGCFAVIAAAIVGQNHAEPFAESHALKSCTVASASRCDSQYVVAHCLGPDWPDQSS